MAQLNLADLQKFANALGIDSIDLLVSEIRQQGAELLRLHSDICDGIELATEQVQDKRIEFLERGPEVKVEEIFITVALTLLLESTVAGLIVGRAFRFAGDATRAAYLASRASKIARLQTKTSVAQKQLDALQELGKKLEANLAKQGTANRSERGALQNLAIDLRREIEAAKNGLTARLGKGGVAAAHRQTAAAAARTRLNYKSLSAFLEKIREPSTETGVAALKAAAAGREKKGSEAPPPPSDAVDSIGVQIQAVAQSHFRDMEKFFAQVEADADLLRGIARAEPHLRAPCLEELAEIYVAQQGTSPEGTLSADVKRTVALEIEKLIWAVLCEADLVPLPPPTPPDIEKSMDPGIPSSVRRGIGPMPTPGRREPPPRVIAYWKKRFFAADTGENTIIEDMRKLKDAFFAKSEDPSLPPIRVLEELAFKT